MGTVGRGVRGGLRRLEKPDAMVGRREEEARVGERRRSTSEIGIRVMRTEVKSRGNKRTRTGQNDGSGCRVRQEVEPGPVVVSARQEGDWANCRFVPIL
ncbi:UNVERIFIED_CONTAM: hypothetical protein Sangu_1905800 [Sesamum angustifolium]|uniref:Uncharacterized protein n=1 Tax=Sesamum angustifolium TaxID=2727405 RepID=A0AAW2LUM4_9LAMI